MQKLERSYRNEPLLAVKVTLEAHVLSHSKETQETTPISFTPKSLVLLHGDLIQLPVAFIESFSISALPKLAATNLIGPLECRRRAVPLGFGLPVTRWMQ